MLPGIGQKVCGGWVVVGGGWWWGVVVDAVESYFSVQLKLKPS